MLIARAPVRISFAGGGTDLASYYREYGGLVVSTSIDKYFYTIIKRYDNNPTQIISADYNSFSIYDRDNSPTWETNLQLPGTVLSHLGMDKGLALFLACEIPPGTGLGSSSAAVACLIKAVSTFNRREISKAQLGELACHIEIEIMQMPIGKQDQYASAFGGLNKIEFLPDERVLVTPLQLPPVTLEALQARLMLFYTGVSRHSNSVLTEQKKSIQQGEKKVVDSLHALKKLANATIETLEKADLDGFGEILHEGWQFKKNLANKVSNTYLDEVYASARNAGAIGGKINGAGGGGFMMLYANPEQHAAVTSAVAKHGLRRVYFRFEQRGTHVLLDTLD
jgi:D-glycero-alpha-D-manno-heptose-7-phosphate kinase